MHPLLFGPLGFPLALAIRLIVDLGVDKVLDNQILNMLELLS